MCGSVCCTILIVHESLTGNLAMRKVSFQWVIRWITEIQKETIKNEIKKTNKKIKLR